VQDKRKNKVSSKRKEKVHNIFCLLYNNGTRVYYLTGENMKIITLEETESTNSYAKTHIDTLADNSVIIAKRQTSGRGRLNRSWVDLGEGNLFMSIVLKPSETFNEIYSNLTQYLSVMLCKVLEDYRITPQIKWPNDVLISGKKIAGILAETVIQEGKLKGLIIGLGVNLNAKQSDIDEIPDKIATALNIETGKDIELNDFCENLTNKFFTNYENFLENGFALIENDYINRNCFLDKEIKVKVFDKTECGIAKSVTNKGELVLQTKENKELVLTIGDIL
jgi:BirA family biotin operon repressor/biotin-[acetyl-CoA-carboxylase] ligase